MSPEQKVFSEIRALCVGLFGAKDVYDYLPPAGVEYPFVFIGEQFAQSYREHKDGRSKATQVTVHVWHNNPRKRGELSGMMGQIETAIVNRFGVNGEDISSQVIADNSTSVPLMHGILETEIKFKE